MGDLLVGFLEDSETTLVEEVEVRVEDGVGLVGGFEVVEEGLGVEELGHFVDVEGGGLALLGESLLDVHWRE